MTSMWKAAIAVLTLAAVSACNPVYYVGLKFVYRDVDLPSAQVIRDVSYEPTASVAKERLDLFLPAGTGWPVVIFVHGGNWTEGDRGLRVGGQDIYGNIGRFLAANGVGAAVISYRLLPSVDWTTQADDVARAAGWI